MLLPQMLLLVMSYSQEIFIRFFHTHKAHNLIGTNSFGNRIHQVSSDYCLIVQLNALSLATSLERDELAQEILNSF